MTSRTLRKDVSEIPVLVEPASAPAAEKAPSADPAAETFVPRPSEPVSGEPLSAELPSAEPAAGSPLSERERAVLAFEKRQWKHRGLKEQAIRDSFEWSANRYYQVLNALLDRPEAQAVEPALVNRLRRLRTTRQQARSGRAHPNPA